MSPRPSRPARRPRGDRRPERRSDHIRGRIRNRRLEREMDPVRWQEMSLFLIGLLGLSFPVLFDIALQTSDVQTGYAINKLRKEATRLEEDHLRLSIEKASLEALDLVEERARRELRMVPAEEGYRVMVVPPAGGDSEPAVRRGGTLTASAPSGALLARSPR